MNTFKVRLLSVFMLAALLAAFPNSHAQAYSVTYVDRDAVGANDGSSWRDAYTDLQWALGTAEPGAEIWVAEGTYRPTTGTDRSYSFLLKPAMALYGGFDGTEIDRKQRDPDAHVTILSGDIGRFRVRADNSYHVIVSTVTDATTILDGFTVTGGNADSGDLAINVHGGGMYNVGSPTIGNVKFINNSARVRGGGMYNLGNPTLTNVTFSRNTAGYYGGGMYNASCNPTLTDLTFSKNSAAYGGGMYNFSCSPTLTKFTFSDNSADYDGGGMYNTSFASPILSGGTFSGNTAGQDGGGMYNTSGNPELTEVTFSGNTAGHDGGGMFNYSGQPGLWEVTFSNNSAHSGGGMCNLGSVTLIVVTFSENTAVYGGGMYNEGTATLDNVTFRGNLVSDGGGGLYDRGDSTLLAVTFSNNTAVYGGGMHTGGNPRLTNVTFSGNVASDKGGGMTNAPGSSPILTNATFSENTANYGGGMYNEGHPILRNTILWDNSAPEGSQIFDNSYPSTLNDSVVQDDCPKGSICTNVIATDPLLGTLGDYGGRTQTIPLEPGSSAIDAGDDTACPSADQRWIVRPQGKGCDIGAYEVLVEGVSAGTYDDMDAAWSYTGSWITYSGSGPYNNTLHYTGTVGDSAQLVFQGTQFTLIYTKASTRGSIGVYVDNVLVGTINAHASATLWQQTWTSPVFAAGNHTVRLVHAGGGTNIDVDAITILP